MNIYLLDPNFDSKFSNELILRLKRAGNLIVVKKPNPIKKISKLINDKGNKVLAINPDICKWKVSAEDLKAVYNIKAVCLQTTSTQWIDVDYLSRNKIPTINITNWSTDSVAEYSLMLALMSARRINVINANKGIEDYDRHVGVEMRNKNACIVGMGNVAKRLAEICTGLGMEVYYWSRKSRDKRFKYLSLKSLFTKADFLFFAIPDMEEIMKMIPVKIFSELKSTTVVVSVYHCLYNENLDLIDMVRKRKIFGYSYERGKSKCGKLYKANVLQAPRVAWLTKDSIKRNCELWVDNIVKASSGDYSGRVN